MSRDDIRKLLGGYATGMLTATEQEALFEAALDDQELFDALAREQSLRDLLRDSAARAELLAALDGKPARWWASWRPAALAAATAGIAVVAVTLVRTQVPKPQPMTVAVARLPERQVKEPVPTASAPVSAAPATVKAPKAAGSVGPRADAGNGGKRAPAGSGGVVGGAGGAPEVFAAPPPPPPPARAAKPAAEAVIVSEKAADAAAVTGARELFLGARIAAPGPVASSFVQPAQPQKDDLRTGSGAPELGAGAAQPQAGDGQPGRLRALAAAPAAAGAPAGLRYSILRRLSDGEFAPVTTEDLRAGDVVSLRFETNAPGFLNVWVRRDGGAWRSLASFTVGAMRPYTTPQLEPGENEISVWFSQQQQMAMTAPAPPPLAVPAGTNVMERSGPVTYVVNSAAGAGATQVRFTIRLP